MEVSCRCQAAVRGLDGAGRQGKRAAGLCTVSVHVKKKKREASVGLANLAGGTRPAHVGKEGKEEIKEKRNTDRNRIP